MSDATQFEDVQERAIDAIDSDDVESLYVGLLREDGAPEFYFGNDTESAEDLQNAAVDHLGMLTAVLADRSEITPEELAEIAAERAEELALR